MCMLSYYRPGVDVDPDALINGALWNEDGHGWAIVGKHGITIGKSMDPDEAITGFMQARARNMGGPALFHSRWATHGTVNLDNVHPFFVGGDSRTVLAHNGILSAPALPLAGDYRSDTWKFAESILPKWGRVDEPHVKARVSKFLAGHNKIVVLTSDPSYDKRAYLFGADLGNWHEDVWYSNHDFATCPSRKPTTAHGAPSNSMLGWGGWGDDEPWEYGEPDPNPAPEECPFCGSRQIDKDLKYCGACWTCLECFADADRCMCWVPQNRRQTWRDWEGDYS